MDVQFLVSIKHPDDMEPMYLTEEQAKEVYDALHAKFGDFDQARELSQLARESVARELRIAQLEATVKAYRSGPLSYGPGREAFEKYLEGGCSENGRVMRHEGMTLGPTCADPFPETGPSLQDDIEAMIAARKNDPNHIVDANKMVDDADEQEAEFLSRLPLPEVCQLPPIKQPSNTPEPPAEPETAPEPPAPSNEQQVTETREEKALRLWNQYRENYPDMKPNKIVAKIQGYFPIPRPTANLIRDWLFVQGIEVEAPFSRPDREPDDVRAARLYNQYLERYPDRTPNAIVAMVRGHIPKLTTPEVRELIRSTGIEIPDPNTWAQNAANARHAQAAAAKTKPEEPTRAVLTGPKPPLGYRVVDAEAWKASASMISESEIRELAEGGLERIGLAVAA